MKTMSVRFTELEQKRLSELSIKRGGTMSDTVREIIGKHFEGQGKAEADKIEHEKTRARFADIDNALANQVADFQTVKDSLKILSNLLGQLAAGIGAIKEDKK